MSRIIKKRFDNECYQWEKDLGYNELYLRCTFRRFADVYEAGHPVFLKDIYESFGWGITQESCTMGWMKGVAEDNGLLDIRYLQNEQNSLFFDVFMNCYEIIGYLVKEED